MNVGPRNRYCANGVIVANCAIYRGGKCRNCGYEPTPRERRAAGLEFDGRELREVKREEKKPNVKTAQQLMVDALYRAGRSKATWRGCYRIFRRLNEKQGTNYRIPSTVTIGGIRTEPHRYKMLRYGSDDSGRAVSKLYPFTVGMGHGGDYLVETSEPEEAVW